MFYHAVSYNMMMVRHLDTGTTTESIMLRLISELRTIENGSRHGEVFRIVKGRKSGKTPRHVVVVASLWSQIFLLMFIQ